MIMRMAAWCGVLLYDMFWYDINDVMSSDTVQYDMTLFLCILCCGMTWCDVCSTSYDMTWYMITWYWCDVCSVWYDWYDAWCNTSYYMILVWCDVCSILYYMMWCDVCNTSYYMIWCDACSILYDLTDVMYAVSHMMWCDVCSILY